VDRPAHFRARRQDSQHDLDSRPRTRDEWNTARQTGRLPAVELRSIAAMSSSLPAEGGEDRRGRGGPARDGHRRGAGHVPGSSSIPPFAVLPPRRAGGSGGTWRRATNHGPLSCPRTHARTLTAGSSERRRELAGALRKERSTSSSCSRRARPARGRGRADVVHEGSRQKEQVGGFVQAPTLAIGFRGRKLLRALLQPRAGGNRWPRPAGARGRLRSSQRRSTMDAPKRVPVRRS